MQIVLNFCTVLQQHAKSYKGQAQGLTLYQQIQSTGKYFFRFRSQIMVTHWIVMRSYAIWIAMYERYGHFYNCLTIIYIKSKYTTNHLKKLVNKIFILFDFLFDLVNSIMIILIKNYYLCNSNIWFLLCMTFNVFIPLLSMHYYMSGFAVSLREASCPVEDCNGLKTMNP